MSKRPAKSSLGGPSKRQKQDQSIARNAEEITSARQVQQLLIFHQDAIDQLRSGIQSFKYFLESIVYAEDRSATVPKQLLLKEYLESQAPAREENDASPMLPDLIKAWSYGAEVNNDSLITAVSSILALLLKTVSSLIDLRDLGTSLCKTILQREPLKLVSRALASARQKEHIISPSIRLLTEIVTFDGGTLAGRVFTAKSFTFDGKFISRNLSLWKEGAEDGKEDKRHPAVRSNVVRYILALLKHLGNEGKVELLKYGNVLHALLDHLHHDPIDVLKDIFNTLKTHVLDSPTLVRTSKSFLLHERNLSSIATLYRFESPKGMDQSPSKLAHEFLLYACTAPHAGILREHAGWYPTGTQKDQDDTVHDQDSAEINLGLDSIEWFSRYQSSVPVRNVILAGLAQNLRPFSNNLESELLLRIFSVAPELVADYFFKRSGFAFDPKMTATWIGYASFLFSTLKLPLSDSFGSEDDSYGSVPPPTSIVMQNLLPQPLSKKTLTRCLNQQTKLITFFAVRILITAFQKLQSILSMYSTAAEAQGSLWEEGAERLTETFAQRCPPIKDVISTYRKITTEEKLLRESLLRLLALYYQITPQLAAEEKFDISAALLHNLADLDAEFGEDAIYEMTATSGEVQYDPYRMTNLNSMLQIANHSSDIRWLHKPEGHKLSPFMTLIKLLATLDLGNIPTAMYGLARSISEENGILHDQGQSKGFYALLAASRRGENESSQDWSPTDAVFEFLDDVFVRAMRKPIKYEDDRDEALGSDRSSAPVDLLHLTIAEQWPFVAERGAPGKSDETSSIQIAAFIGRYLAVSRKTNQDENILLHVAGIVRNKCSPAQLQVFEAFNTSETLTADDVMAHVDASPESTTRSTLQSTAGDETAPLNIPTLLLAPPQEHPNAPGLHRWTDKDIPTAIADGDLSDLILCLSSSDIEISHAALRNLRAFSSRLDYLHNTNPTTFPDAPQYQLLLGILINTVTPLLFPPKSRPSETNGTLLTPPADEPTSDPTLTQLPALLTTYAALASHILQIPLHPLYGPLNDFHLKGPRWDVSRLASYWTHTILFTPVGETKGLVVSRGAAAAAAQTPDSAMRSESKAPNLETAVRTADISSPRRFLLSFLYLSLRDHASLEILRKRGTLEPIMALASSPDAKIRSEVMELLVRVLWRISFLEGGSDMLVTRKGVMAWLEMAIRRAGVDEARRVKRKGGILKGEEQLQSEQGLKMLVKRIWDTCDQERVSAWSAGLMEEKVRKMTM